jgi:hypothetical protein
VRELARRLSAIVDSGFAIVPHQTIRLRKMRALETSNPIPYTSLRAPVAH